MTNPVIIFGGSFDPIHLGHIAIIQQISKLANPSKFIIVPCKQSVFKEKPLFTAQERIKFIELACKDFNSSHIVISDYEINTPEASYTINTLKHFRSLYSAETQFIFIVGEDAFRDFTKWHQAQEILSLTNLLVIDRYTKSSSSQWHDFEKHAGDIHHLNVGLYPQASSNIKKLIALHDWDKLAEALPVNIITEVRKQLGS